MTSIRKLTEEDFEEVYPLNVYAFHFKDTEKAKERMRHEFDYGSSYGAFLDDQLTSSLIVYPFDVHYAGRTLKMGGIGNVTSYPEVRGQGAVRQLLETALCEMKEQGTVVSYLAPFSYNFYRKFGYEVAFERRRYEIKSGQFGSFQTPENHVDRVLWEDQKEAVKTVYRQKMTQALGPVKRNDWVWENRIMSSDQQKIALYRDEDGTPQGYLLYDFKGEDQNSFVIDEMHALNGKAEKALWEFVGTHASSFDTFIYTGRTDQRLTHLFREADLDQKITSYMMARIVDMEKFLRQFPFKRTPAQEFLLEVTDDTAEWNSKLFKLTVAEEDVSVTIVNQPEETSRYLKADIQTWTQLFMQFKTAEELEFEGALAASKETAQELQELMPQGVPELHDFF